jgi:hypothetical protein
MDVIESVSCTASSANFFFPMLLEQFNDEFDDAMEVKIAAELSEQSTKEKRERCKRTYVYRNIESCYRQLHNDYFAENSTYTESQFEQRFRIQKISI